MRSVRFLLSCDLSRALRPTAGHTFHGFLAWRVSGYIGKCNIEILYWLYYMENKASYMINVCIV